jgi:carboxyl-terminal processing protease
MKKRLAFLTVMTLLSISMLFGGGTPEQYYESLKQASSLPQNAQKDTQTEDVIAKDMQSLTSLYRYVDSSYYEDVDKAAVKEKMAEGMIAALGDEYSFYTPADKANDYQENVTGKFGGIGIYLTKPNPANIDPNDPSTYMISIESTIANTPAQRAGLRAHDMISAIDGKPVNDLTSQQASELLRGDPGTKVTLTINRNGQDFDLTITREIINKEAIASMMLDDGIGYIALYQYTSDISTQMLQAIRDMKAKGNLKALILDERYNPGGDVDECLKCANMFLPAGDTIVSLQGRKGSNTNQKYTASGNMLVAEDIPIVILANKYSASSAEIFAAALHDNKRATLIGTKTFGKGIFQTVFPFGEGYVQITTGRYYTPSGVCIHKTGIEPDIEAKDLEFTDEEMTSYEKLTKDNVATTFVKEHPDFTAENSNQFIEQEKESGIRPELLKVIIRNAYLEKVDYDKRPIADPANDPALERAVTFIRTGK